MFVPSIFSGILSGGCALQRDHEALAARTAQVEKDLQRARVELAASRADLEATRQRLDNALRANADSSTDFVTSKQRINDLAGKLDEATHGVDDLRRDVSASRTELYARLDELKRAAPPPPAAAPPAITAPADKAAHFKMIEDAHGRREWAPVRALAPEYVNRYPQDERADKALYFLGNADLQDGRPSSALGHFNRLLKLFPKSPVLDRTLFDMGEAYMMMHDCTNAKLAYDACEKRFTKDKIGDSARAKLQQITKNAPGLCAPQ
ncbi:MAG: hypothetical protein KF819_11035 [Labilithrix sp.]|nr:hypothetical protein [Labilithrix sp.]